MKISVEKSMSLTDYNNSVIEVINEMVDELYEAQNITPKKTREEILIMLTKSKYKYLFYELPVEEIGALFRCSAQSITEEIRKVVGSKRRKYNLWTNKPMMSRGGRLNNPSINKHLKEYFDEINPTEYRTTIQNY